ncbi:MAG: S9 family peptidase [Bacteroidetes bacterium]|nr:MAG: S9 family peptidase [Bacteroidota bacterium]REK00078.1 MAG: S9 family peptidase [Bacteroidota bacterium]REK35918.1 MAG: S9 family peptidase [Bacteroidota bacterium]REK49361.1 MAG: S9 family peptidase [Bacteroidota bacterium]
MLLSFPALLFAQGLMKPETLQQMKRLGDAGLSPSGDKIVYTVRSIDLDANKGNTDIWIYNFSTKSSHPLANDAANESMPRWSKDGKKIYFLSNKNEKNELWMMNADGSGKRTASSFDNDILLYGIAPSEDKIWIVMEVKLDNVKGSEIYPDLPKATGKVYDDLMARHWDSWADGSYNHIFIADMKNGVITGQATDIMQGERFDSPMKPFGGDEQISWSPDGKSLAYSCKKLSGLDYAVQTNSDVYIYDVASGKTSNLSIGMMGYDKNPSYSPDGKMILWISQAENGNEADRHRIFVHEFASNTGRELTKGFDLDADNASWSSDGSKVYFIANTQATEQIFVFNLNEKKNNPIRQLTSDIANYTSYSIAKSGRDDKIIATRNSMSVPSDIYLVDAKTGQASQLTDVNKEILASIKRADVKKRMVKATDGKDILTWVIYPPDFDPAKKYPALLYCQGGPQSGVSQFYSFRWNMQLMASQGYIVVAPNRRGLPGFGQEWNDQISGDWGGQCMLDLLSAIDDVAKESYVDNDRLGAVGASFGGYSVFWLAGNHNKRFKAFISHNGVYNLESMLATEEIFFYNHEFEGPYWTTPKPKSFVKFSPHTYVANWDTPILIIANEKDYRVPYTQGLEAFSAARMKNIPSRLLTYHDENHWVLKAQNSVMWQREFFSWLDKYLK